MVYFLLIFYNPSIDMTAWWQVGSVEVTFRNEWVHFYTAVQICIDLGVRIYEPKTKEDQAAVADLAANTFGLNDFWIGVHEKSDSE